MHTFVVAGGCFWCLDAVYRTLKGVSDVVSGYTGGHTAYPDYESVCTGTTGHAEAVAVTFDPEVIPDSVILDVFFSLHDPRQINRQGNDVGTQYRSAMFYAETRRSSSSKMRASVPVSTGKAASSRPSSRSAPGTPPRATTRTSSQRTLVRDTVSPSLCPR